MWNNTLFPSLRSLRQSPPHCWLFSNCKAAKIAGCWMFVLVSKSIVAGNPSAWFVVDPSQLLTGALNFSQFSWTGSFGEATSGEPPTFIQIPSKFMGHPHTFASKDPRHSKAQNPTDFFSRFSRNSSWAEWGSQFLLETAFIPSWFAGSSWFRLGFRCLSPFFFSLLSFLRKGVLFHHDLLVPLGSGWGSGACLPYSLFFGSGACLPSSLFFLSSGKRFCSILICWFLLVPAGVPVLVSLILSSLVRCLSPFFSLLSLLRKGVLFHHDLLVPPGSGCLSRFSLLCFRCLPPFFSLHSFLRKGVLFHHDLLVPLGSGWGSGACLPFFSLLCFRCLPPFFSLLSFLRKGVLFHHDLLVPPGSGWGSGACLPSFFFGSGACLPSSLFFLSSGKGFCSIMICWFLLVAAGVPVLVSLLLSSFFPQERGSVWFCSILICCFLLLPAGVRVLVSLLLSSFFPQERGSVPSWFAGSSWFRLGFRCLSPFFSLLWFRCLSPFFSLLSFLRKEVLFHHDLLVPPGSGWGSGACLPSLFFGSGACLPSSLFFLSSEKRGSVPSWFAGSSWFRLGFRCLSPLFSLLWFRCLSPFFSLLSFLRKEVLFHPDLLVPPGSGWGSCACLPSSLFILSSGKGFCSIMICWFLLVPAGVPVLVSLILSSLVRCLSPFFSLLSLLRKGVLFHHDLLVPLGSGWSPLLLSSLFPVLASLLLSSFFPQERGSVPSWFAGSSWFRLVSPSSLFFVSGACLPSSLFFLSLGKGFCSIMICWFLLVPAGVPVLVSLLLSSFFSQEKGFCSMGLCWRHCSQEKTACTSFGPVWKFRTSTLCGFLDASGRLFYCLVFVRLK